MPAQFCQPCREHSGRLRAGTHITAAGPLCEDCFHGGNPAAIAKCRKSRIEVKEEMPMERKCKCNCGKPAMATRDYAYGHKPAAATAAKPAPSTAIIKVPRGRPPTRRADPVFPTIQLTPEVSFADLARAAAGYAGRADLQTQRSRIGGGHTLPTYFVPA